MSINRQFNDRAASTEALHDLIAMTQLAMRGLDASVKGPPVARPILWKGRALFGLASLSPCPQVFASVSVNGLGIQPVTLDPARPLDNRRRLLFAINAVSAQTGLVAHPDQHCTQAVGIRLAAEREDKIELAIHSTDPTRYLGPTQDETTHILGGVVIRPHGDKKDQGLPFAKVYMAPGLGLGKDSLQIKLPCQPVERLSACARQAFALSLQHTLIQLQALGPL